MSTNIGGYKVGKLLKEIHEEVYASSREPSDIFRGGNVGTSILGLSILESTHVLSESINNLARVLEENSKRQNIWLSNLNPSETAVTKKE